MFAGNSKNDDHEISTAYILHRYHACLSIVPTVPPDASHKETRAAHTNNTVMLNLQYVRICCRPNKRWTLLPARRAIYLLGRGHGAAGNLGLGKHLSRGGVCIYKHYVGGEQNGGSVG